MMILPESLLLVVHPRHGRFFLGRIFVQVRGDHRLGQLKIPLVHLPFSHLTLAILLKALGYARNLDDTREPHREMSRRVLEESSLSPTGLTLSTSPRSSLNTCVE